MHTGSILGQQLRKRHIGEMHLFKMLRAEPDTDLEYLRRLLIYANLRLNWQEFGTTLFYWGPNAKRRILQDYFTPIRHDSTTA